MGWKFFIAGSLLIGITLLILGVYYYSLEQVSPLLEEVRYCGSVPFDFLTDSGGRGSDQFDCLSSALIQCEASSLLIGGEERQAFFSIEREGENCTLDYHLNDSESAIACSLSNSSLKSFYDFLNNEAASASFISLEMILFLQKGLTSANQSGSVELVVGLDELSIGCRVSVPRHILIAANQSERPFEPERDSCYDSDGIDAFKPGAVYDFYLPDGVSDRCTNRDSVIEYFCDQSRATPALIPCEQGCYEGACL